MFKKHGDGKIISVITSDEGLDEQQKKSFKHASNVITTSTEEKNSTDTKKLES